jgi:hypothetical protein
MASFDLLFIMNALLTCILTDSTIQQTGCILAAMDTSGTVTCKTFSNGFNTYSGQTTSTRWTEGNSQATTGEGYRHLHLTRFSWPTAVGEGILVWEFEGTTVSRQWVGWLKNCGSIPGRGRSSCLLQNMRTSSWAHPASYLVGGYRQIFHRG